MSLNDIGKIRRLDCINKIISNLPVLMHYVNRSLTLLLGTVYLHALYSELTAAFQVNVGASQLVH